MIEPVQFKDLNFKLAVINNLMYEQDLLKPRFDIREFIKNHNARRIDLEKEGYEIIPEAQAYFESLLILPEYLSNIEELYQDGGNEIYMQISPLWDGEDDRFDIHSSVDAALLPKLTTVTLFYNEDKSILEQFEKRGIKAQWL